MVRWAAYGGMLAAVVSALGIVLSSLRHRMFGSALLALAGVLIGLLTAAIPWSWMQAAKKVPAIHDITTDTVNPPQFQAILLLRKNALNPVEYGGPEIAAQQLKAYPDVKTLVLNAPVATAFQKALENARGMGWNIVAENETAGRIEAVDRTFWFGFEDDIVIRIMPQGPLSRVDIRSVSRVGKSDIGTNAKRIRKFLDRMKRETPLEASSEKPNVGY